MIQTNKAKIVEVDKRFVVEYDGEQLSKSEVNGCVQAFLHQESSSGTPYVIAVAREVLRAYRLNIPLYSEAKGGRISRKTSATQYLLLCYALEHELVDVAETLDMDTSAGTNSFLDSFKRYRRILRSDPPTNADLEQARQLLLSQCQLPPSAQKSLERWSFSVSAAGNSDSHDKLYQHAIELFILEHTSLKNKKLEAEVIQSVVEILKEEDSTEEAWANDDIKGYLSQSLKNQPPTYHDYFIAHHRLMYKQQAEKYKVSLINLSPRRFFTLIAKKYGHYIHQL